MWSLACTSTCSSTEANVIIPTSQIARRTKGVIQKILKVVLATQSVNRLYHLPHQCYLVLELKMTVLWRHTLLPRPSSNLNIDFKSFTSHDPINPLRGSLTHAEWEAVLTRLWLMQPQNSVSSYCPLWHSDFLDSDTKAYLSIFVSSGSFLYRMLLLVGCRSLLTFQWKDLPSNCPL